MASIQRPPLIMGRARMVQNCVLGVFILIALIATQPASAGRSLLESEDSAKTHHLYWTVINDIGLKISPGPSWLQFLSTDPFFFFPLFLILLWVQIECIWIANGKQTSSDLCSSRMNNLVHTEWTHWQSVVKKIIFVIMQVLFGSCQDANTYGVPTVQALQRAGNESISLAGLFDDLRIYTQRI